MPVSRGRDNPAARRPAEKADLHQIRFVNILNRDRFLPNRGGDRFKPNRAAVIVADHGGEQQPVDGIEPQGIDFHAVERRLGVFRIDHTVADHLREIPRPL